MESKCKYATNVQFTRYVNILKRHSRGFLQQANGDCLDQLHSDKLVLETGRWEAGPHERQPKALKTKLGQGGS
jgi:hypothetical protein